MTIDGSRIETSLLVARQQELLNGGGELMTGLAQAITPEAINNGVQVDFGADKASFIKILNALGLDTVSGDEPGSMYIERAVVYTLDTESYSGTHKIAALGRVSTIAALNELRSNFLLARYAKSIEAKPTLDVTSQIIIASSQVGEGRRQRDETKPVIAVGSVHLYPVSRRLSANAAYSRVTDMDAYTAETAAMTTRSIEGLDMLGPSYFIKIGALASDNYGSYPLFDVRISNSQVFSVESEKVVAHVNSPADF